MRTGLTALWDRIVAEHGRDILRRRDTPCEVREACFIARRKDPLTFDSGKSTVGDDQIGRLQRPADAMLELLDRDPGETF